MSPSFSWEGKTVLVWVKVLPFLCLLQIFHSPWELSMDHTLLKNNGSFWSGKLKDIRQTQELHSKQRWAVQALPWVPSPLREQSEKDCLAQPGDISAARKAASGCCPPENKPPSRSLCTSHFCYQPFPTAKHLQVSPCHELLLTWPFLTHRYSQKQIFAPQKGALCLIFCMVQRKSLNPW